VCVFFFSCSWFRPRTLLSKWMAIPFRLRCTPAGTISCALRLMVAASESLCYKFSQFLIPFCKRFSGVLVNFMGIMVSISFLLLLLLLLYESMFYSPPLPSYRKKKKEKKKERILTYSYLQMVLILVGVVWKCITSSMYGFKSQSNCYVSFFFIFQSTYLGAS
jgi:hypothetical protein